MVQETRKEAMEAEMTCIFLNQRKLRHVLGCFACRLNDGVA